MLYLHCINYVIRNLCVCDTFWFSWKTLVQLFRQAAGLSLKTSDQRTKGFGSFISTYSKDQCTMYICQKLTKLFSTYQVQAWKKGIHIYKNIRHSKFRKSYQPSIILLLGKYHFHYLHFALTSLALFSRKYLEGRPASLESCFINCL